MTKPQPHSTAEIEAFAERYGLTKLTKEHLARMQELAPIAAELGGQLPRPSRKSDAPAPSFPVLPIVKI
ncbi:MAG: hypothetical protein ACI89J_003451 [Hyphomicrobiaceae bacterium]|jgi:hypothetical protein